jgi:hypothetical protein
MSIDLNMRLDLDLIEHPGYYPGYLFNYVFIYLFAKINRFSINPTTGTNTKKYIK